jgi:hypothetical protein
MASPKITCVMSGGPQDGVRHQFDILPIMLLVREPSGGTYERTGKRTADGAHVFEYRRSGSRAF